MRASQTAIAIALLLILTAAAHAASTPIVQQLLPAKDSVKGFSIMPDSLQYGKGDGITSIYNGGYELYTKNGVVDAARQMYQSGSNYVEVTVHTMKSDKAALDFLKHWQKENKVGSLTRTKTSTSFAVTKPNIGSYCVTGKYLTTVTAFHSGSKATADVKSFMAAIEKKALAEIKKSAPKGK